MTRRALLASAAALAAGTLTCDARAQDLAGVEIVATHVAGSVYMLKGAGGNIGVSVGEDGFLIVDDQFAPLAEKIRQALREIGSGELQFILNTHWHRDHTDGNLELGPEATIIAHAKVRKRLEQGMESRDVAPFPPEALPVITFDASLSIHFNGEEIRVIHVPAGHTDGDCVVYFTGSNVVHMGDHFFAGAFPFVDLESGGNVRGYIKNVEKVISEIGDDAWVIPGHGPLTRTAELRAFHAMMVETSGIVRTAMKAGKTLEQIKNEGLPDKWEPWSSNFVPTERWIETIYRSYAAK